MTTEEWAPPSYADPARFTERELDLTAASGTVGGTLTLPEGRTQAGVVLLTGGGPLDRDETSGPNKPLKDLAWGLAGRGIAVLRFDKISFLRPESMTEPGFTMTGEYLPHAVEAVRTLRRHTDRVFVAGHSMGGKIAPLVAATEPAVAGVAILAGDTQPMHRALVRVGRYLAEVAPELVPAELVEQFARQAAVIDRPDLSPATPAADLPFGLAAEYWLDQRVYDPAATAAALDRPILILQGGRDYQVTVADDLPGWQRALAGRSDVIIRVIAADNHQFVAGNGPSTPDDYGRPGHVDPSVITTLADWIDSCAARPDEGPILVR
ncbi:alpha/beta hydrolase family protein [Microlunatus speluncae]|uniref:alpha/beta hydrolase family protein n=1 Tax=Microlunatus speluncae TaxID=2594267 RepID=UPI001C2DBD91|nr:alpha/beta hydrolase [Microlunatus speluncae]